MIEISQRLKKLPPYLFAEIDRTKTELKTKGLDLIDLGVGDLDQPTPQHIVQELCRAVRDPANHRYALDLGLKELRVAIAEWYEKRFKVSLDPENEVQPLIGSKEGIAHIPLALVNPGELVLVPDPGYPPYRSGTILAEGIPYPLPLLYKNNFLPDFKKINSRILKRAKLIFLNYPNNPTGAVCSKDFFEEVVGLAKRNNLVICHDAAYSEVSFEGYRAPSFLEVKGARQIGIEFHSLSKTYSMTGWRVGWACGNNKIIGALGKVKSNIDSGIFQAVQWAGITALKGDQSFIKKTNQLYAERRDCLIAGLDSLGWKINPPKATFYVWAALPKGYRSSIKFAKLLLEKANIVVTPGIGFGYVGEGYVRFALTISKERIQEAVERIKKIL